MKTRILHTRFWDDSLVCSLSAKEKLFFIYLLTNERNNLIGVYELSDKRIMNDLDITKTELQSGKEKLMFDKKVIFYKGWIKIINHDKYNTFSGEKNEIAKKREWSEVPEKLRGNDTSIDTSMDSGDIPLLINNINKNKKPNNIKTYTKDNLTIEQMANKFEDVFKETTGKSMKLPKDNYNNLTYWLDVYTNPNEIVEAITQIPYDDYWKGGGMTPTLLFRRKNPKGEPVDYIGQLLNSRKEKYAKRN